MIRVLFVDHAEAMGGAEHSLLLLMRHLDRARFHPILACNAGPLATAARAAGVDVREVDMPRLRREPLAPLRLWRGVRQLAALIRREAIAVVHANAMRASLYAAPAARLTRRPLVWHVRDIYAPGLYARAMGRMACQAIAVSQAAAAPLPASLPTTIIPNGVDLAELDATLVGRETLRAEWGVHPEAVLVGLVGRLEPWKGQAGFLRAMARVAAQRPEARFALVGGAIFGGGETYAAQLRALAGELGLAQRTVFAGHRHDLGRALAALDILVHCSVAPEPFGRVVIEGMAARLPVVAFGWGGPAEIILPGETGLLVPPADVEALAAATLALMDDPTRRARLGAPGRARVEGHYDVRALTRRAEQVLAAAGGELPCTMG